jgi:molybdate transport system regulatory protein
MVEQPKGIKVKSKFWIVDEKGRPVFGGGRMLILQKIDELGSMRAASDALKMSYRAVWGKIKTTEERLGMSLVETTPGGGRGRGAALTPAAKSLLRLFEELSEKGNALADELFHQLRSGKY